MTKVRSMPAVAALGWTLLVIISLSLPGSSVPSADLLQYDKVLHAALFGVGVFLWLRVPAESNVARWIIVLAALAFAPASELYQELLGTGRAADPWDAVADVIGVVIGASMWLALRRSGSISPDEPSKDDGSDGESGG